MHTCGNHLLPGDVDCAVSCFLPRFEEEEKSNRPTCSFVPFGHGPRNCIGMKFARLLMKIVLVVLLQDNRFTITPDTRQSLEIDCPTITAHVKHRVFIQLKSRKDH